MYKIFIIDSFQKKMIFIIDHIHHLMNESKMLIFAYNSDRYIVIFFPCLW